jgi:hypothetical protein
MAVIGELAAIPCLGDHGSSRVSPPRHHPHFWTACVNARLPISALSYHDGKDMAQAADIARRADIVFAGSGISSRG